MTPRRFGLAAGLGCLLVLLFAPACRAQTYVASRHDDGPKNAIQVTPDSMWLAQYAAAEACLGLTGDVADVKWFIVRGDYIPDSEGGRNVGLWIHPHRIYILESFRAAAWVVRHESMHDLLGNGKHPRKVFGDLCRATWGHLDD